MESTLVLLLLAGLSAFFAFRMALAGMSEDACIEGEDVVIAGGLGLVGFILPVLGFFVVSAIWSLAADEPGNVWRRTFFMKPKERSDDKEDFDWDAWAEKFLGGK